MNLVILVILLVFMNAPAVLAQETAISYQGRLSRAGLPASGFYDFQFSLYDSAGGGTKAGEVQTQNGLQVSGGEFRAVMDFGAPAFDGFERWLQVAVRTNGGGDFEILQPRQRISSAPYAIRALEASALPAMSVTSAMLADGSVTAEKLSTNALAGAGGLLNTYSNIAQSRLESTNSALVAAMETGGRTNTVTDTSVGLEVAGRIAAKLSANTNVLKVMVFGDSIGGWDLGGPGTGIHQWLGRMYGNAGNAGMSVDVFGNGLELCASSVGSSPAVANQQYGTNWWGFWHSATNGATVRWGHLGGNGDVADNVGLFWIAHPMGGVFDFQVSTNGGPFGTLATLDGYSATRTARYTNFVRAANRFRVQAATTCDATNIFIGGQIFDSTSNGVVAFYVFKGGANLANFTNIAQMVWDNVLVNYNPDLFIYNMAEFADIGATLAEYHLTNSLVPWLKKNTNTVVWLTGNSFRGDSATNDADFALENAMLRRAALANGYIFTDTRFDAQSWERINALGYMYDLIHYNQSGALALGFEAMKKAGLLVPYRPTAGRTMTVTGAVTNSQSGVQFGSLGIGTPNSGSGLLINEGGTQSLRVTTPGGGYQALYFGTNTANPDFFGYGLLGDSLTTSLNVRSGGMVAMRVNNSSVIWSTNANSLEIAGTARGRFSGGGSGLTNIPVAGVSGLSSALLYLSNGVPGGLQPGTPPEDPNTIRGWASFTNSSGVIYKLPLYQ